MVRSVGLLTNEVPRHTDRGVRSGSGPVAFPGITTPSTETVAAPTERQTFKLYGHQITDTNAPVTQQLSCSRPFITTGPGPQCLCRRGGAAMCVAKIGADKYVIKTQS